MPYIYGYDSDEDEAEYCTTCERYFINSHALFQHYRDSAVHFWCSRCTRLFVSKAARETHLNASSRHNLCKKCYLDFSDDEDLRDHNITEHNMCVTCSRCFDSYDNLRASACNSTKSPIDLEHLNAMAAPEHSQQSLPCSFISRPEPVAAESPRVLSSLMLSTIAGAITTVHSTPAPLSNVLVVKGHLLKSVDCFSMWRRKPVMQAIRRLVCES
ncbi:MAG: hypothetical protein M1834_007547 [Cirrosporium novae-zelandiae]|nr:MAG: hypothetical protein M1834_007547 [Cirrosporium novae-zelandiae]